MRKGRWGLTIVAWSCSAALVGVVAEQALAALKKPKEQTAAVVSAKSPTPLPEQPQKPSNANGKKAAASVMPERQPEVLQKQAKQTLSEVKPMTQKGHRRVNVHKKHAPKAVVQPRQDLTHHGLLEDSQRYDPRPNHRTAGVQNPQTPELTHDHFQELDRNQDGKIDPVERVFGRLDMDRDLHDRQLQ
jgi:hypothetical protein